MALNIKPFLVNTATWRRRTGTDPYGDPQYAETEIKVRWDEDRKLVRSDTGSEVVSESVVMCLEGVRTGDALRDSSGRSWPVINAAVLQDIKGRYIGVSVRL